MARTAKLGMTSHPGYPEPGQMPPEDEAPPSDAERQVVVDRISKQMTRAAKVRRFTDGQGVMRRLTRDSPTRWANLGWLYLLCP